MSAGNSSFRLRTSDSGGNPVLTSRWATWAMACTPASVRPEPYELEVPPASDRFDRAIELALHRPCILLNLPAAVPSAGVLDGEAKAGHDTF